MATEKKWIVKTAKGEVLGPFTTEHILSQIRWGEISGDEQVSVFPKTEWIPISSATEFYDQLLAALQSPNEDPDQDVIGTINTAGTRSVDEAFQVRADAGTLTPTPTFSKAHRVSTGATPSKKKVKRKPGSRPASDDVLELKPTTKLIKKAKTKNYFFFGLVAFACCAAALVLIGRNPPRRSQGIRLIAPRPGQKQQTTEVTSGFLQKALGSFVANDADSLVSAQSLFVQAIEGDSRNTAAFALLCMTYWDLWPFAVQDGSDLQTISQTTQMASAVDPAGADGSTCRAVDLLIQGRTAEAESLIDSVIGAFEGSEKPPVLFYYLKGVSLTLAKEDASAINYAQAAEQLWPAWLAPKILLAEVGQRSNQTEIAVRNLNAVLMANPRHMKAMALLGLMELRELKNTARGKELITAALQREDLLPPTVASESYLGLAEIALAQGSQIDALEFAKKAYSRNSTNQRARALVVQLGGEKSLQQTKLADRQLLLEGDQLVREGDCAAAQALYKTAFEVNRRNALAAMKAGDCLWKINLATEAIDWLNSAIGADPNLIDAYVILSDFYSQRFMFEAAARTLNSANAVDPKSYKIFRGLARLELRRRNGAGASQYAQQAINLYEADVESYVILAEASLLLDNYTDAITASRRAREIDVNNREAQIVHAKALFGAQGAPVAIDYLERLVKNNPVVSEYRLALGDLYFKDQSYEKARDLYEQVIRIEDKPKQALLRLGDVQQVLKQNESAVDSYLKAATVDPSDPEPLFLTGKLFLDVGKASEARDQFQRVLAINKDYPLVNYNLGRAAFSLGSTKEALDQVQIEMKKNPRLADPHLLAAEIYDQSGQYTLCASEYQRAVKIRPQGSMMYVRMARCYRLSGSLEAAVSMVNIANSQESGNPEVWKEQGLIFEAKGDRIRAIEAFEQYLVLAPNAPDADQVRAKINGDM
jgi:tetratricopeptide (TPR) repeat protein